MPDQTDAPTEPAPAAAVNPAVAAVVQESEALSGASTPHSIDPAHDDDLKSKKVHLADLSAKGTALYAHKNYEEAAEVFSRASIIQAEINGETAPENAEILFHYGRSLFKVGQSKSDVLGASAPKAEKKKKPANGKKKVDTKTEEATQEGEGAVAAEKASETDVKIAASEPGANKPLFQFTGDENFDDSADDEVRAARPISRHLLTLLPGS